MVELALGLLVFVTILIAGIHFAEVGYLSVKVTEASHSALLDATGRKLHDWPSNVSPAGGSIVLAGQEAQARYTDFESRSSSTGSGSLNYVFTRAQGMTVQCRPGGAPSWSPFFFNGGSYSDNGGMNCTSSAQVAAFRLPTTFMEQANQGYFKKEHFKLDPITVCGIGRGPGCQARLTMMLDDWGLSGSSEGRMCLLIPDAPIPCTNTAFWNLAAQTFIRSGAGMGVAGSQMAQSIVGAMPLPFFFGAENAFWLSAPGEETLFVQPIPSEGWKIWPTSPGLVPGGLMGIPYTVSYIQREGCFLGRNCP